MNSGTTFIFSEKPNQEHLWMVVTNPKLEKVVIVNFTSFRLGSDESCVVDAGEHPFVRKKTCVNYADAKVVPSKNLAKLLGMKRHNGSFVCPQREPLSNELLLRIQQGAVISDRTPLEAKSIVEQLLSP